MPDRKLGRVNMLQIQSEIVSKVSADGDRMGIQDFSDESIIDIKLNQRLGMVLRLQVADGHVAEPRSQHDEQITLIHQIVAVLAASDADRSVIEWMIPGNSAFSARCRDNRNVKRLGQLDQLFMSA
ncbi:hypothetical protein D3C71_1034090 [compost metagenome]